MYLWLLDQFNASLMNKNINLFKKLQDLKQGQTIITTLKKIFRTI